VINEYGASELGVIAMADPSGALAVNQSSVYLELVDDLGQAVAPGATGRVVLTALHNKAHALIRYDIGDLAQWDAQSLAHSPKLSGLLGRTNDMAHLPQGKRVPGLTFYYVTKAVINDQSPVLEFVVEQHREDHFVIRYVSGRALKGEETQQIQKALEDYVGAGLSLDLIREHTLDRSKRGKLRQFSNLMAQD
jgi:phenylacetate-CoA ligase